MGVNFKDENDAQLFLIEVCRSAELEFSINFKTSIIKVGNVSWDFSCGDDWDHMANWDYMAKQILALRLKD